jgi:DNA segregation ATPase FtsK/SpoIIIE-like protein
MGAEALTGMGDSLFVAQGSRTAVRVQGAFISSEEVEQIVSKWAGYVAPEEAELEANPILVSTVQRTANNMHFVSIPMIQEMWSLDYKQAKAVFKKLDLTLLSH